MTSEVRLAVIGVGDVGRVHASKISQSVTARLGSLSDPSPRGEDASVEFSVPNRVDYRDVLSDSPHGVVLSVPNALHREAAEFFAKAGVHLLVEKPLADSVEAAAAIIDAARTAKIRLSVGHHRRHSNVVREARKLVSQQLGTVLATNTLLTMRKPDSYYDLEWRRGPEAGPLLVNVIHEIDLLRTICGEISTVQAIGHAMGRGFEFDDTLAITLHYSSGAVGTMVVSESTPSPWSWESSVSGVMGFATYGMDYLVFFGSEGSLSFPGLRLWRYGSDRDEPGWNSPLTTVRTETEPDDPYLAQIDNFVNAIRGTEALMVEGEDALRSLAVVEAIRIASTSGSSVDPASVVKA